MLIKNESDIINFLSNSKTPFKNMTYNELVNQIASEEIIADQIANWEANLPHRDTIIVNPEDLTQIINDQRNRKQKKEDDYITKKRARKIDFDNDYINPFNLKNVIYEFNDKYYEYFTVKKYNKEFPELLKTPTHQNIRTRESQIKTFFKRLEDLCRMEPDVKILSILNKHKDSFVTYGSFNEEVLNNILKLFKTEINVSMEIDSQYHSKNVSKIPLLRQDTKIDKIEPSQIASTLQDNASNDSKVSLLRQDVISDYELPNSRKLEVELSSPFKRRRDENSKNQGLTNVEKMEIENNSPYKRNRFNEFQAPAQTHVANFESENSKKPTSRRLF